MTDQPWVQVFPGPGLDPGFRWDINGRAQFRHKGYSVDVLIRQATTDDAAYYVREEPSINDVVIVGTVSLDHVELSNAEHRADITEPFQMSQALAYVLDAAVEDARRMVGRLVERVAEIDAKQN
jgi:hypothetical protein